MRAGIRNAAAHVASATTCSPRSPRPGASSSHRTQTLLWTYASSSFDFIVVAPACGSERTARCHAWRSVCARGAGPALGLATAFPYRKPLRSLQRSAVLWCLYQTFQFLRDVVAEETSAATAAAIDITAPAAIPLSSRACRLRFTSPFFDWDRWGSDRLSCSASYALRMARRERLLSRRGRRVAGETVSLADSNVRRHACRMLWNPLALAALIRRRRRRRRLRAVLRRCRQRAARAAMVPPPLPLMYS